MRSHAIVLFFLILLAACTPTGEREPAAVDSPAESAALDVATLPPPRPSATPTVFQPGTPSPTDIPVIDPTVLTTTPWPPDPLPSPTPAPAFPGMVYKTSEGLWFIDEQWASQFLKEGSDVIPGPGATLGNTLLYSQDADIWLWNSAAQEGTNLTNTPDQIECCPMSWRGAANKITYLRNPEMGSGVPILYDLDSGEETVLSIAPDDQTMSEMSGSPDGRYLAYELNGTDLWLHDLNTPAESFQINPAEYGFPENTQIARLGAPSWSPDSQQLAVVMAIQTPEVAWQIALGIFDLNNKTFRLFHPYENAGRGGWFPSVPWSPDGQWIAFGAEDINPERGGLWIINTQNDQEINITGAFNPVWSPDGQYLSYQTEAGTFLTYPPDFTYKIGVILPEGATIVEWVERP